MDERNNGQDVVKICLQVEALGNSVAFDFEGNFQKEIQDRLHHIKIYLLCKHQKLANMFQYQHFQL